MAVFDIFDEISGKWAVKNPFGTERIFGTMIGVVAENYSEKNPGCLRVQIPVRDKDANTLKWAKMAFPYFGKEHGFFWLPEKDDQVLLVFEDGNVEKPFIIGVLPRDTDSFLKKNANAQNSIKKLQTKNGNTLTMIDDENEGAKDQIRLETGGEQRHFLCLDNDKQMITLSDKENKCSLSMSTREGNISFHAEKSMEITVGDQIKIRLNGDSGKISIEAQSCTLHTGKSTKIEADGSVSISGKQMTLEGVSSLKQSSGGMLNLEGKPIKLG